MSRDFFDAPLSLALSRSLGSCTCRLHLIILGSAFSAALPYIQQLCLRWGRSRRARGTLCIHSGMGANEKDTRTINLNESPLQKMQLAGEGKAAALWRISATQSNLICTSIFFASMRTT